MITRCPPSGPVKDRLELNSAVLHEIRQDDDLATDAPHSAIPILNNMTDGKPAAIARPGSGNDEHCSRR